MIFFFRICQSPSVLINILYCCWHNQLGGGDRYGGSRYEDRERPSAPRARATEESPIVSTEDLTPAYVFGGEALSFLHFPLTPAYSIPIILARRQRQQLLHVREGQKQLPRRSKSRKPGHPPRQRRFLSTHSVAPNQGK